MQSTVCIEMNSIMDKYVTEQDLNESLHLFVQEKVVERSKWSDITRYTHMMLGGCSPRIEHAAALTELLMLALDIVDDLQDQDNMDKPWMQCSRAYALNAVLAIVFASMAELSELLDEQTLSYKVTAIWKRIGINVTTAVNGQQQDLNYTVITESDYISMVKQKSGSLIHLACFMGYALLDEWDDTIASTMEELSHGIGMISQLENDLKDLIRYDVKNDLLEKKRTLPILFLLNDDEPKFPFVKQYYDGDITKEEFIVHKLACIDYIHDSGCMEYTRIIQSLYRDQAEALLASLPAISPWKEQFRAVTFSND